MGDSVENESANIEWYPVLAKSDDDLLEELFAILSRLAIGNPYGDDSEFAKVISSLPLGLRAMAATHNLDVSLTLDSWDGIS
jgi:hypothetical protein